MREIILALGLVGIFLPSSTLGQEAHDNVFAFVLTREDYEDVLKRNEFGRQELLNIRLGRQFLDHSTFNKKERSAKVKANSWAPGSLNLKTSVSASRWKGEIALRILPGVSPGNYFVDANLVSLSANIPKVSTSGFVVQRVGSVETRIRVNGNCSGVQVKSIQGMRVSAELNWKIDRNQIVSNIRKFQVLKSPIVQGLDFQSCSGFSGYSSEVRKALMGFLQSPSSLQKWMEPFLISKLRESLALLQSRLLSPRSLALSPSQNLWIHPSQLRFDTKTGALILEGFWKVGSSAANSKALKLASAMGDRLQRRPASVPSLPKSTLLAGIDLVVGGSRWIFNSEELRKALVASFQPDLLKIEKKALEVPGLKKVLGSRWVQSVAWPDLHNFPLLMDFKTETKMEQLSKLTPGDFVSGYQKINYFMESLWRTRWSFPNDQEYMKWNYQAKWKLGLAVVFGALEVSFDQVALNLSVDSQRGKKALNRGLIEKELTKAIVDSRFYVPLPPIDLQTWGYFYPSHFTQAGETVSLHYFPY